jgi:multidrug efflux pump subunit AcrA (membrane-fusion protein)
VLTGLLVVVAGGAIVAAVLSLGSSPTTLVSERTVTVTRGVIQTVVSCSGNLAPARQLDVDFATSGKINKVYAKAGAQVSNGELLARLDQRGAKVAVAKAQADLVDAEDALTAAQDAEATEVAASADDDETATAASAQTSTVAFVAQATPTPTATATPPGGATPAPTATATPGASATPAATASPSGGTAPSGGGSGESSSGGATQSVESAQAAVDSAQLALDDAEDALEDTLLRAPMAGTVASISGGVGDTAGSGSSTGGDTSSQATSGSAFIVLAQLSRLKLEVGLSESDIGKVEIGQSATVTINAASGEDVAGHLTSVGVLASDSSSSTTGSSGAVSYPVTITLDQTTEGIKAGMSATADIVVARVSGLAVPSQALRGSTVTVERNGTRTTQQVRTGVVGDSATQIVSGLDAGEKVVVTSTSALQGATASGQGAQQSRTGLGGAGGFGAGGGFRGTPARGPAPARAGGIARRRDGGPRPPPAVEALGRPAAAGRGRARDRHQPGDRARGRADGQPRLALHGRGPRRLRPLERRGPDGRDDHPRARRRGASAPRDPARRRRDPVG